MTGYMIARDLSEKIPVPGYNTSSRGIPDLAFAGDKNIVRIPSLTEPTGVTVITAGTSASCPIAAAMFSNINAARLAIGKGSIGWVNRVLDAKGASFVNDITFDDNKFPCTQGYYATVGWDPTTGLGSVNYDKMQEIFLSLREVNGFAPTKTPTQVPPTVASMSTSRSPSKAPTRAPSVKP